MPIHEAALWAAYLATRYVARIGGREIELRVGARSPELDAWLAEQGAQRWCFVTAWNPDSQPLDPDANRARNAALRERIGSEGWRFVEGEGRGATGEWPAEASFLVVGPDPTQAVALARAFGQRALVLGERGGPAELVDCRPAADA